MKSVQGEQNRVFVCVIAPIYMMFDVQILS